MLVLYCKRGMDIPVGKLGNFTFARGWYLYVGSAFGPGGVAARCRHHRQVSTHPRWHIDYLRAVCDLREVWFTHDPVPREHLWAKRLASKLKLQSPVHGFGASDCGCGSHLFFSAVKPNGKRFLALASRKYPAELPVYCEFV